VNGQIKIIAEFKDPESRVSFLHGLYQNELADFAHEITAHVNDKAVIAYEQRTPGVYVSENLTYIIEFPIERSTGYNVIDDLVLEDLEITSIRTYKEIFGKHNVKTRT
jgi:hypothetical protein